MSELSESPVLSAMFVVLMVLGGSGFMAIGADSAALVTEDQLNLVFGCAAVVIGAVMVVAGVAVLALFIHSEVTGDA